MKRGCKTCDYTGFAYGNIPCACVDESNNLGKAVERSKFNMDKIGKAQRQLSEFSRTVESLCVMLQDSNIVSMAYKAETDPDRMNINILGYFSVSMVDDLRRWLSDNRFREITVCPDIGTHTTRISGKKRLG